MCGDTRRRDNHMAARATAGRATTTAAARATRIRPAMLMESAPRGSIGVRRAEDMVAPGCHKGLGCFRGFRKKCHPARGYGIL